jgi:hypothetical protein
MSYVSPPVPEPDTQFSTLVITLGIAFTFVYLITVVVILYLMSRTKYPTLDLDYEPTSSIRESTVVKDFSVYQAIDNQVRVSSATTTRSTDENGYMIMNAPIEIHTMPSADEHCYMNVPSMKNRKPDTDENDYVIMKGKSCE